MKKEDFFELTAEGYLELETELNELQDMQNELRQSAIRTLLPSGWIEPIAKNFSAPSIIYSPSQALNTELNSIAIAPAKASVNGQVINLIGNFSTDEADDYLLLNLGEAPDEGRREDLVYLEVWQERLTYQDSFNKEGYQKGDPVAYNILDSRINEETTQRIVLKYDIKVVKDIDFETLLKICGQAKKIKGTII